MAKKKHISRKIEVDINDDGLDSFIKLANAPEGREFGVFPNNDGSGATMGRLVQPPEYEGEGLQEPSADQTVLFEESLTIDIRYSYQTVDKAIVELALKGSGRNFRYEVSDIPIETAYQAAGEIGYTTTNGKYIVESLAMLLWPVLVGRLGDHQRSRRVFDLIVKPTKVRIRRLLRLTNYQEKQYQDPRGFKWTEISPTTGRLEKSDKEKQAEKRLLQVDVFRALDELESRGRPFTKWEAGNILYPTSANPDKTLENALTYKGLSWMTLKNHWKSLKN